MKYLAGSTSTTLRFISLTTYLKSYCDQYLGSYKLSSGQMCALGAIGVDTCSDAGAPLVCNGKSNKGTTEWVLVGLDSTKLFACDSGFPAVFTYVNQYLDFLIGYKPVVGM